MQADPAARLPAMETARSESAPSVYDCEKQVETLVYEVQWALDNDDHEIAAWYLDALKAAEAKLNRMRRMHSWYLASAASSQTTRLSVVLLCT